MEWKSRWPITQGHSGCMILQSMLLWRPLLLFRDISGVFYTHGWKADIGHATSPPTDGSTSTDSGLCPPHRTRQLQFSRFCRFVCFFHVHKCSCCFTNMFYFILKWNMHAANRKSLAMIYHEYFFFFLLKQKSVHFCLILLSYWGEKSFDTHLFSKKASTCCFDDVARVTKMTKLLIFGQSVLSNVIFGKVRHTCGDPSALSVQDERRFNYVRSGGNRATWPGGPAQPGSG